MSDGIGANTPVTQWPLQQAPGDRCVDLFIDALALSFFSFCSLLSLSLYPFEALFCGVFLVNPTIVFSL